MEIDSIPVIAEDDDLLMDEFDNNSDEEVTQKDKNAEEELVEQLEDFETMRDNLSDMDENEEQDDVLEMTYNTETEKENDRPEADKGNKGKKIVKNPSRRQIHTSESSRDKDFGIVGKAFNENNKKNIKEQMSPRDKDKQVKKKDDKKKVIKEREVDLNVIVTGNQLRPGEIVANEKGKNRNQKSIIGWFYKHKK